ncbi:hypothetical protein MJH12_04110, partial [bacterium]|nr:hypothetical protein [bacterium]
QNENASFAAESDQEIPANKENRYHMGVKKLHFGVGNLIKSTKHLKAAMKKYKEYIHSENVHPDKVSHMRDKIQMHISKLHRINGVLAGYSHGLHVAGKRNEFELTQLNEIHKQQNQAEKELVYATENFENLMEETGNAYRFIPQDSLNLAFVDNTSNPENPVNFPLPPQQDPSSTMPINDDISNKPNVQNPAEENGPNTLPIILPIDTLQPIDQNKDNILPIGGFKPAVMPIDSADDKPRSIGTTFDPNNPIDLNPQVINPNIQGNPVNTGITGTLVDTSGTRKPPSSTDTKPNPTNTPASQIINPSVTPPVAGDPKEDGVKPSADTGKGSSYSGIKIPCLVWIGMLRGVPKPDYCI